MDEGMTHGTDGGSTIGEGLDIAAGRELYDAQCKRLLSERGVLAWLLKGCLAEFADGEPAEIAQHSIVGDPRTGTVPLAPGLTNAPRVHTGVEDSVPYEGAVAYDVLFDAVAPGDGQDIEVIVNVEMQLDYYPGYPLENRALFYCARMVSAQYGEVFTNAHYEKLRKVVSIWLCPRSPHKLGCSIDRGLFVMYDGIGGPVPVGDGEAPVPRDAGLLEVVFVNLGAALRGEGFPLPVEERTGDAAADMVAFLATLLSGRMSRGEKERIIEDVYGIPVTPNLAEEADDMVHVVDMIWAEAKEEGLAEGKIEGKAEGKTEGMRDGLLMAVRSLMDKLGLTAERAIDMVGVAKEDAPAYLELLSNDRGDTASRNVAAAR